MKAHQRMIWKIAVLVGLFFTPGLKAQIALVSSGGGSVVAGGSVQFSVGQVDYIQLEDSRGSAYLGVQQPFPAGDFPEEIETSCGVYPNPNEGVIFFDGDPTVERISYEVYDLLGKKLTSETDLDPSAPIVPDIKTDGLYIVVVRSGLSGYWLCKIKFILR